MEIVNGKPDVDEALDSLGQTALRVKEERDALLLAAQDFTALIDDTALIFNAKQIQWLQKKPTYKRLIEAIEKAESA